MAADLVSKHYGEDYFAWQNRTGDFNGWANRTKFESFVSPSDTVIDFGCGSGTLLAGIRCARRIGVEPNPAARQAAMSLLDQVFAATSDIVDGDADVVISNHALEHTLHPLLELQELRRVLRPGGQIVIVVPSESMFHRYKPGDINHHLYTWSPMTLGNLLQEAC